MSEEIKQGPAAGLAAAMPRMDKDADPNARPKGKRKRKVSYLTLNKIETVDYKEVNILRKFINDRGKMLPARQSGNTAAQQRMISTAIRRAREMALLPFVVTDMTNDRPAMRRSRRDDQAPMDSGNTPVESTAKEATPTELA
jgi:small subunit ribosomal protein S18